jgi:hypothetical protein
MDLQPDAIVVMERSGHPVMERRIRWVADREESRGSSSWLASSGPALHPLLLPLPREITVATHPLRGSDIPVRYTDNGETLALKECLGPHCVSGEPWTAAFAREYHQGVRADGKVVLLYRDVETEKWYLAGWWD